MRNKYQFPYLLVVTLVAILATACEGTYDVPLTSAPTQKIDARLFGDWKDKDGQDVVKVRKYDDSIYIISLGGELYRAYHSQTAGLPLISVQDIESPSRKYAYFIYRLSADGAVLELRPVDEKTIPNTAKTTHEMQRIITQHAGDPKLFEEKAEFVRQK
jgi:hypothetical protein